jgi:hypothetical protein
LRHRPGRLDPGRLSPGGAVVASLTTLTAWRSGYGCGIGFP